MHDPLTVAFEIRRPWPKRNRTFDAKPGRPRWAIDNSPFWVIAGRGWYWPSIITIWHREPAGRDSGEVCKQFTRHQVADRTWTYRNHHAWRLHLHHWKIQISPLQDLRRWALTRCTWCGGPSRKGDQVDVSFGRGDRGPWWRGETGLYHHDCSSIASAHRRCLCAAPLCADYSPTAGPYGVCARCGKHRPFGAAERYTGFNRALAAIPEGVRDRAAYADALATLERLTAEPPGTTP